MRPKVFKIDKLSLPLEKFIFKFEYNIDNASPNNNYAT